MALDGRPASQPTTHDAHRRLLSCSAAKGGQQLVSLTSVSLGDGEQVLFQTEALDRYGQQPACNFTLGLTS